MRAQRAKHPHLSFSERERTDIRWLRTGASCHPATRTATPLPSASTVRIMSTFSHAALIPSSSMIGTENSCAPGEDIGFTNAHGAAVGPDDMLYLTDDFGHAVRKC